MKIDIRSQGVVVSDDLREHIERCVSFGLDWAEHDVDRIVVSLSDINVPLSRMRDVVIEEVACDLQAAIAHAVDRAAGSLERRLSRQREFGPTPVYSAEE